MPQKVAPKCVQCDSLESLMWRIVETGSICQSCYEDNKNNLKSELEPEGAEGTAISNGAEEKKLRKSTRSTRYKAKSGTAVGTSSNPGSTPGSNGGGTSAQSGPTQTSKTVPKGRGRRNIIFKKPPTKAPIRTATTTSVDSLFYNGSYVQIGDIVSLMDNNEDLYYAQIRGLLIDTYCEKSAFITWLIPTKSSPPPNERFDASTYLIGPDEDFPRKLSCMEFVMHAPSNYYYNKTMPHPPPDIEDHTKSRGGFIWTNMTDYTF